MIIGCASPVVLFECPPNALPFSRDGQKAQVIPAEYATGKGRRAAASEAGPNNQSAASPGPLPGATALDGHTPSRRASATRACSQEEPALAEAILDGLPTRLRENALFVTFQSRLVLKCVYDFHVKSRSGYMSTFRRYIWDGQVEARNNIVKIERLGTGEELRLQATRLAALHDAPGEFGTTFEEASRLALARWTEQLKELPTFIAVDSGRDIGIVRCAEEEDTIWIISMWVAPTRRSAGVGGMLIDATLTWTHSTGARRVLLDVTEENQPALALYRKKGFRPTGVLGRFPEPRTHIRELQMAFVLRPGPPSKKPARE